MPTITFALVALGLSSIARAQILPGVGRDVLRDSTNWFVASGLHVGSPAKFSAAIGVARVLNRPIHLVVQGQKRLHLEHDVFLLAEPGMSGGRISFGYGAFGAGVALSIRASLLRTWSPWTFKPDRSYIGLEGSAPFDLAVRAGVLIAIDGPDRGRRVLFPIDLAFGW